LEGNVQRATRNVQHSIRIAAFPYSSLGFGITGAVAIYIKNIKSLTTRGSVWCYGVSAGRIAFAGHGTCV